MDSSNYLSIRNETSSSDDISYGPSTESMIFAFFGLVFFGCLLSFVLLCLRRKRMARQRYAQALLPRHNVHSHHRSVSVTNLPTFGRNDAVFVYDEKMNLIANSSAPPTTAIPQIRVTFPDEDSEGHRQTGRVVVVHVTDTGSVGMAPLEQDQLPPYQRSDAERFQSLDMERIGGLREKEPQRFGLKTFR